MTDNNFVEKFEETIEVKPETKPETKPEVKPEAKIVLGKVTDCEKLNVRRGAIETSDVSGIISKDDIVEINEKRSTEEWYRVHTENGLDGFCMKKYITKLP